MAVHQRREKEMSPDIAMCRDDKCPSAMVCYRFMARPSGAWQTYFAESPRKEGEDKCGYFWEAKEGK